MYYGISGQMFARISSFPKISPLQVVLDGKSSQEYPVNVGFLQGSILILTLFILYINDLPDDVICNIAIFADDTTFNLSAIRHLVCGNNKNWLLNLNLIYKTLNWAGSGTLISMLQKLDWFRLTSLITLLLLM